jgi:hypothetical protein
MENADKVKVFDNIKTILTTNGSITLAEFEAMVNTVGGKQN